MCTGICPLNIILGGKETHWARVLTYLMFFLRNDILLRIPQFLGELKKRVLLGDVALRIGEEQLPRVQ